MPIWLNITISIISGLATCIPLVIELVKYIKKAIKSKNWTALVQLVLKLMKEAEKNYKSGAERKQYVIDTIKAMESTLNYDINEEEVAAIIDSIVDATKMINVGK